MNRYSAHGCTSPFNQILRLFLSGLLLFSIGAGAQTVGGLPQLLQQAGLPDIVTFDGGTGSIETDIKQCTPTTLEGRQTDVVTNRITTTLAADVTRTPVESRQTGVVTNLKMTLNTNTLAANVKVTSTLGNLSVNINDIRREPVEGTWSANLKNKGTPASATGALSHIGEGGGVVSVKSATRNGVKLKFENIHLDIFPAGTGEPCTDVVIFFSAVLPINFSTSEVASERQAGAEVTQVQALGNFANNVGVIIPVRIGSALGGPRDVAQLGVKPIARGMMLEGSAAGDGFDYPFGLWASYQRSDFQDDFVSTQFDAKSNTVFVGADFSPWDNFLAGVAFGYESVETDTTFNFGQQDSSSYSLIPYFGVLLNDHVDAPFDLTLDMALGYSAVEIDQFRVTSGTRVASSTNSKRWFVTSNVAAAQTYGNWYLGGRLGFLYAKDNLDGFTETDGTANAGQETILGRVSLGADAAYLWGALEPFASATYQYDFNRDLVTATHPDDADDVSIGTGVRWYGDSLSATFEYNTILGREDFDSSSYQFSIRGDF